MSLARVPLTLAAALAFHVSMSPPSTPHPDTPDEKRVVCNTARVIAAMLTKGLFWASALTDTLVVLAPHVPASLPPIPPVSVETLLSWVRHPTRWGWGPGLALALNLPAPLSLPHLPLGIVAGTTLALAGAYLRYAAYHTLGQFYACPNLGTGPCVRPHSRHAHALITTGPYAFVRHPGYAGLVLCTTGLVVLQLDALKVGAAGPWGWVGVSVGMRTVALVCAILGTVGSIRRVRDEEQSLRARFKGEWEAWARTVPYRLVPGVY